MMRNFLVFILILFLQQANAQNKENVKINWTDKSNVDLTLDFRRQSLSQSEQGYEFNYFWEEPAIISANTAKLTNVVYENATNSEFANVERNKIPQELTFNIRTSSAKGKNKGFLTLNPLVIQNGQIKKVLSFTIDYQVGQRKNSVQNLAISSSVLATGDWFRFYVDKTGVYRITPDFLRSLGLNLDGVNPATIKIFGNGGQMLPLINQENTAFDPLENPLLVVGGEDGVFSGNDYILFYAEGTTGYNAESDTHLNLYDDKSYYYVTYGGSNGKRISTYSEPSGAATTTISTFTDEQFYEVDQFNLVKVGRKWYGDAFDIQSNRSYDFSFPNLNSSTPVELRVTAAAVAQSSTNMSIAVNGTNIGSMGFSRISESVLASGRSFSQSFTAPSGDISIQLEYNNSGNPAANAYLDYINIKAERNLVGTGNQMLFYNESVAGLSGIGQYAISNAQDIQEVWDITDKFTVSSIRNTTNSGTLQFKASLGEIRKYIAVVLNDTYQPLTDGTTRLTNQNLKGTIFQNAQGQLEDIDYLIITRNAYTSAANRLASHHRALNNLNVKVVTLGQIYNEFSGGKQDIVAIRNLVKYVCDNASNPDRQLKYVCLLGDASVDYRGILQEQECGDTNVVPTFESLESFSLTTSFATDDFYGALDPEEGSMAAADQLDLAIGRILADSPQLAEAMVSKIISYSSEEALGRWRNTVLLVSDDVDESWEERIQRNLNELGDDLNTRKPFVNVNKIYADAFQQESSSSGNRYPTVNERIVSAMETGTVLVNYFGHGGEDGLAKEFIFTKSNAAELNNENRLPFLITVTCEFTKFDNPCRDSAGEIIYRNTEGGVVGLISTTRNVTVNFGIDLNDRLAEILFPDGNEYPTGAEAVRLMKNSFADRSRRVVFFFGDPAMKVALPKPNIRLTSLNDIPLGQPQDTIKALSLVKIAGEVVTPEGTLINNYNGVLSTTIYDKSIDRTTLANDGVRNTSGELIKLDFTTLGEIIFRGKASVNNGVFNVEFVVPKDIKIPVDTGRISFYSSQNGTLFEQAGADETILVGGINENAPEDNVGPQIELFLNDENFVSGDVTDKSPVLIVKLQDENGINTASGIGHDIVAILDNDETNPIVLNDYYETEIDDFTKGVVNFKFKDLEPGSHTLNVKGWDVYNNSSSQEIEFTVAEDQGFALSNVLNYPNPFVSQTEFWFDHSSIASDLLSVQVQVFTVSGKVVWTTNQELSGNTSYRGNIQWNGRDDFGDKLGKGVYVYKISVKSTLTNERVEKIEKLVIL